MSGSVMNFQSHFELKIDGQNVPDDLMNDVQEIIVEQSLYLPDVCTIRMYDMGFKWLDDARFKEGKKVEVNGGWEADSPLALFKGEIVGLELDLNSEMMETITVRCYSKMHRLHRGRQNRSFVQMKDSDLVSQIAGEAGLTADAEATTVVHDWVFQHNQTNWEFLKERAAHCGYRLYLKDESTLCFKKVEDAPSGAATVSLEWGKDLRSFRPRTAASPQVNEVTVRGWDPMQKQEIIGTATSPQGIPSVGMGQNGGAVAQSAYSAAKMIVVDRPVHNQNEATGLAQSILDDIAGTYLEADGLAFGNPHILPGSRVEIKNVGTRFSGKYIITATTHTYAVKEGYNTLFTVSGKHPSTVLSLLDEDMGGRRSRMGNNIVIGIVTDNTDPEKKMGRVKVKYPHLTGDHTSYWARIASPMAGNGRGFYFLPEVDDEVLVAFEHGDIRRPYILGALWNGTDVVIEGNDEAVKSGKVNHRIIKTREGHTLLFEEKDGGSGDGKIEVTTIKKHVLVLDDQNKKIEAKTTNGHVLVLDDQNKMIEAKTTNGHKVTLDDQGNKIVIVDPSGSNKMTIEDSGNIKLECNMNFDINAKGKVTIQGLQGVEISTPMQAKMSGAAGTEVSSAAQTKVTAPMVEVSGAMVKIN